jgi:hypothetical protein
MTWPYFCTCTVLQGANGGLLVVGGDVGTIPPGRGRTKWNRGQTPNKTPSTVCRTPGHHRRGAQTSTTCVPSANATFGERCQRRTRRPCHGERPSKTQTTCHPWCGSSARTQGDKRLEHNAVCAECTPNDLQSMTAGYHCDKHWHDANCVRRENDNHPSNQHTDNNNKNHTWGLTTQGPICKSNGDRRMDKRNAIIFISSGMSPNQIYCSSIAQMLMPQHPTSVPTSPAGN